MPDVVLPDPALSVPTIADPAGPAPARSGSSPPDTALLDPAALVRRARRQSIGDLLRRTAARNPDATAIVFGELRQTYAELDSAVNRMANAITERGIGRGDRVAMLGHNHHAYVVTWLALARLGVISVPINFMLKADEVAFVLAHAGAVGIVAEDTLTTVADHAIAALDDPSAVRLRGAIGEAVDGWGAVADWIAHPDDRAPDVDVADDDPIQIMYTSGTESRPKGATLSSRALIAQYISCVVEGRMTADDVEVHALPLYHCAQLHAFLMPDLYLGATSIVLPGPDPADILATIERERVTKLFCPPTVWISLLRHPDFDTRDLSSLRKGYYGASIMPVEVLREILRRLPDVALFNLYGQTEMSPLATFLAPEDQERKAGSAGRAVLNVETLIVDDDDVPVPAGTIGEIIHRSPQAMLGYWNDPTKTADTFRNGWLHSGDLGVIDDEGFITVVDRKKDMIKTGGENVASREVEEMIYAHPAVSEVAVFSIPDPKWIEAVAAAVVVREGQHLEPDEIIAFCRQHLAGFKVPKSVRIVAGLPKNASGKVLKRELRDVAAADPS
ncbi:MAG: acyl-CoA synthetase [Ilumatobacteraceae bacterium]|nr:acyl-CoA synthetase [Ilumatobacteraceae bacterium]